LVAPISGWRKVFCDGSKADSAKVFAPGGSGPDGQSAFASDGRSFFNRDETSCRNGGSEVWSRQRTCNEIEPAVFKKIMTQSSGKIYIPPYSGVRLVECRDHLQLAPVPAFRVFYGYGKVKASKATDESEDGKAEPIWDDLDPDEDIWAVLQWFRYEDGHEERGGINYLRSPHTEEDARKSMEDMKRFYSMTRQELLKLTRLFEATEDDYAYIEDNYPNYQSSPDPNATDEYDVYQARLKVLAGLQPITVELIKIADITKDPEKRQKVEREAVQSYFAELAHYWTEDEILAWQRSNPVGTGWMCEFASVFHEPRRQIDSINHELALNWLRQKYNLLTAEELSHSIFKRILKWLTPDAIKKRRERLGLTTKREPGSPKK
jgi:hypothetical protein